MRLSERLKQEEYSLSFEVFPPKTDTAFENVLAATEKIAALKPSFVSVTYGAGGAGSRYTLDIAGRLREKAEVLAHLTCVGTDREGLKRYLSELRENHIENIMALRGDLPENGAAPQVFPHAADLIREIRKTGDFCIGAACYPEVHPESPNQREDIAHLREKTEAGAEFLTTQMFFDNNLLYNFLYKLREAGVNTPVLPGVMPITAANQVERAVKLSGSFMPRRFASLVDRFGSGPEAMKRAGILYATDQIVDLFANGIRHVHVYTMNKPEVAAAILGNLEPMLGRSW